MTRRGEGMVEVELLGDPLLDEEPAPDQGASGRETRTRRRTTAVVLGAVVVLVGALSAGSTYVERAEERADDARVAAVADVDGVGPSLREPPTERWRLTATSVSSLVGDVVMARDEHAGVVRTVARDAVTGETRWVADGSLDETGGLTCADALADDTVLLCLVPGLAGEPAPNTDVRLGGTPDRLVALGAQDGRVQAERELAPGTVGWDVLDGDLVVAVRVGPDVVLERSDVRGGDVRWTASLPVPQDVLADEVTLAASDGLVVLAGRVAAVLDGTDGRVLGRWESAEGGRRAVRVLTSSVGFAVWPSAGEGTWFNRQGEAGVRLVGAPMVPWVDDGSAAQVLLVADGDRLRAVDVQRGPLWSRPMADSIALRIDGRLLLVGQGRLAAVDVTTGDEAWSVELGVGSVMVPPVTDGVRVLVPRYEVSSGRSVTAHDLADGSAVWTMPLPEQISSVSVGGGLLVGTGNQIAVFD